MIAAYSGYGNNIVLEKGDGLAVHHDKERAVVTLEYQVHGKAIKAGAADDNRFVSIVTISRQKLQSAKQDSQSSKPDSIPGSAPNPPFPRCLRG